MAEKEKSGVNYLIFMFVVTVVAGITVAAITNFVITPQEPIDTRPEKELTYYASWPQTVLDVSSVEEMVNVSIIVNGTITSSLYSTSVQVWNSGKEPIKNLPIEFVFSPFYLEDSLSKIISISYRTYPEREFGDITADETTEDSRRYVYELLNPGDEFTVTFLTFNKTKVEVFSKAEGLTVKEGYPYAVSTTYESYSNLVYFIAIVISFTIGFAAIYLKYQRDQIKKYGNMVFTKYLAEKLDVTALEKSFKELADTLDEKNKKK